MNHRKECENFQTQVVESCIAKNSSVFFSFSCFSLFSFCFFFLSSGSRTFEEAEIVRIDGHIKKGDKKVARDKHKSKEFAFKLLSHVPKFANGTIKGTRGGMIYIRVAQKEENEIIIKQKILISTLTFAHSYLRLYCSLCALFRFRLSRNFTFFCFCFCFFLSHCTIYFLY